MRCERNVWKRKSDVVMQNEGIEEKRERNTDEARGRCSKGG